VATAQIALGNDTGQLAIGYHDEMSDAILPHP
jgi:hypothetical protein